MSWHSSSGHGNSETSLNSQITILFLCLSFVCLWNTTQQERTLRGRYTCCLVYGFLSDSGSMLLVCVEPFPSLPGFKNGDFHFCEGVSSSDTTDWPIRCMQSADVTFTHNLRSLGTSSKQMLKMVPGTTCYHRMENRKCALYCQCHILIKISKRIWPQSQHILRTEGQSDNNATQTYESMFPTAVVGTDNI